jgi:hypothetical protein
MSEVRTLLRSFRARGNVRDTMARLTVPSPASSAAAFTASGRLSAATARATVDFGMLSSAAALRIAFSAG